MGNGWEGWGLGVGRACATSFADPFHCGDAGRDKVKTVLFMCLLPVTRTKLSWAPEPWFNVRCVLGRRTSISD